MQDNKRKLLLFTIVTLCLVSCQFDNSNSADHHLKKARSQMAEGYHGSALIELKSALKINPVHIPSLLLFDEINTGPNKYKENIHFLSEARIAGINHFSIFIKLIKNYLASNNFDLALQECELAAPLASSANDQIVLNVLKARSLTGIGEFQQAEILYKEMLHQADSEQYGHIGLSQIVLEKVKRQESHHWSYINILLPGQQYFNFQPEQLSYLEQRTSLDHQLKQQLSHTINVLNELIEDQPDNPQITSLLGNAYYYNGQQTQAINLFSRALALDAKHGNSLFTLARINVESGYFDTARKNLEQLLANDKQNLQASNLLAALYIRDNHLTDAELLLEKFIKAGKKDEDLFVNLGNLKLKTPDKKSLKEALSFFEQAIEVTPESVYSHAMLATAHLLSQDASKALKEFKQARYLDPDNPAISTALIESNFLIENYSAALRISKTQVNQHPDSAFAHYLLGLSYQKSLMKDEARQSFQQALKLDPTYSSARIMLVQLLKHNHQLTQATQLLKEGLEHNNKEPSLIIELAIIETDSGDHIQARNKLLSVLRNNPEQIRARILLGYNYLETGNINKALSVKNKLRGYDRDSAEVLAYSGALFDALGNIEEAKSIYQSLISRVPGNPEYLQKLGDLQAKSGEYEPAQKILKQASRLYQEKSLSTLVSLAELYIKQANLGKAKEYISEIEKLSPTTLEGDILYGDFLFAEKKFEQAIAAYDQVLKKGFQVSILDKINRAYIKTNDHENAVNILKKWINDYPEDLKLSLALIETYQQIGNSNAARKECERIQKFHPENIWILHKLAGLYKEIDIKQAFLYAKRAYEIGSDSPKIHSTYNHLASRL